MHGIKSSRALLYNRLDTDDVDAVCSLTLRSDKHALVSDQNILIIYHKGNVSVRIIIMKRCVNVGNTGARPPSEDYRGHWRTEGVAYSEKN